MNSRSESFNIDWISNEENKSKVQKWAVIFIVVLTLFLGFKIITIERNNTAFNTFFTETKDRIKLLSTEVGSIEKKITKEKAEDDETKI